MNETEDRIKAAMRVVECQNHPVDPKEMIAIFKAHGLRIILESRVYVYLADNDEAETKVFPPGASVPYKPWD